MAGIAAAGKGYRANQPGSMPLPAVQSGQKLSKLLLGARETGFYRSWMLEVVSSRSVRQSSEGLGQIGNQIGRIFQADAQS